MFKYFLTTQRIVAIGSEKMDPLACLIQPVTFKVGLLSRHH
jgi:hypothetical protein